jgi:hypothetical protein
MRCENVKLFFRGPFDAEEGEDRSGGHSAVLNLEIGLDKLLARRLQV